MKRLKIFQFLVIVAPLLLMQSCDSHIFDFAKSTGKIIKKDIIISDYFHSFEVYNNINVVITQTTENDVELVLEGGENLLPGIELTVEDSVLKIKNKNIFNWVRAYNKDLNLYLKLPYLYEIKYRGVGTVTCTDTIRLDSLVVNVLEGSGIIDLKVNTQSAIVKATQGSSDIVINGKTHLLYGYNTGLGSIRCGNFKTNMIWVSNFSPNDCFYYVTGSIDYKIKGLGNIYCKGNPPNVSGTNEGGGRLILEP